MKSWLKAALLFLPILASPVLAQDSTCNQTVQQAVATVRDICAPTARNQACYGNVQMNATPRDGVQNFEFNQQGDIVNVVDLQSLRLSSLDLANNTWGVAYMQLQANLPATLPGQNVTFLLFGNVDIQNDVPAAPELTTLDVTSTGNINVRSGPSTNNAVAGTLDPGQTVTANGRNANSSWLRIVLPDSDALGWVFAQLLTASGDVSTLSVVDATDTTAPLETMQSFRFSTGVSGPACEGAPQDGILIQTPEGVGTISLRANGVDVKLGSTGYFQAEPGANMTVSIIEGQGTFTADGVTVTVPAGAQVEYPD